MTELQIYLDVTPGKEKELEDIFTESFVPAISVQEGFKRVELIQAKDALSSYQINLMFDTEQLRLKWVASPEHRTAFPKIAALCLRVTWRGFEVIMARSGVPFSDTPKPA